MGYGYLRLDAMDPVEEVGDLAGDSVLRRRGQSVTDGDAEISLKGSCWLWTRWRESGSGARVASVNLSANSWSHSCLAPYLSTERG